MRLSPLAAIVVACALTLTSCGGDDDPKSSAKKESPSASDSPTFTMPTKPGKGKKSKRPDFGTNTIRDSLDADTVGGVLDATVERGEVQNNTCVYTDTKNASLYVAVTQATLESMGGADAAASSLAGMVAGDPQPVEGIGDAAYVVAGQTPAGVDGVAGLVVVGDSVVSVGFPVVKGTPDEAKAQLTELLAAVADAA